MKDWYEAVTEANDLICDDVKMDIQGYDIDGDIVKNARQNAAAAGVDHLIHLQQRPVRGLNHPKNTVLLLRIRPMVSGWRKKRPCLRCTEKSARRSAGWIPGPVLC